MRRSFLDSPPRLQRFRVALDQFYAGLRTAPPSILCIGDSNTSGLGSVGDLTAANKTLSWPTQLATVLTAKGIRAREAGFVGTNVSATQAQNIAAYDPRWTWGSGWGPSTATLGGYFLLNGTTTNQLLFTPTLPYNRLEIFYVENTGNGTFTIGVNGQTGATVNSSVATGRTVKTVYGLTQGLNPVNIARVSGNCFIAGMNCVDTAAKEVTIMNAGVGGALTGWFSSLAGFGAISALQAFAPDLTIIQLIINDATNVIALATYEANLRTIIDRCLIYGDVMLSTSFPCNHGIFRDRVEGHRNVLRALSRSYRIPLVEIEKSGWPVYDPNDGRVWDAALHPNAEGYRVEANIYADSILGAL